MQDPTENSNCQADMVNFQDKPRMGDKKKGKFSRQWDLKSDN